MVPETPIEHSASFLPKESILLLVHSIWIRVAGLCLERLEWLPWAPKLLKSLCSRLCMPRWQSPWRVFSTAKTTRNSWFACCNIQLNQLMDHKWPKKSFLTWTRRATRGGAGSEAQVSRGRSSTFRLRGPQILVYFFSINHLWNLWVLGIPK